MDTRDLKIIRKHAAIFGARGGKKTALRGPEYFRKLQKKSVKARKSNLSTATACK